MTRKKKMAKTENFNQERIDARDYAMQVFCWCMGKLKRA